MPDAPTPADLATNPAPPEERPARPVPRIEAVLAVVSILINYGLHLAKTLEQRAVRSSFATIARFFGTVAPGTIMAHIRRGLMRAMALDRMLRARARRGRDLQILAPHPSIEQPEKDPQAKAPAVPASPTPAQAAAAEAAARKAGERLARRIAANEPLTLDNLPRMAAIEAEVRRTPIGRTIAAICRDLGISASLCDGMFWNAVCDAVEWYRGSLADLVLDIRRRERTFHKEEWKHPELDLVEETRAGVRRALGFFIGEDPIDPLAVAAGPGAGVAAVATGPP